VDYLWITSRRHRCPNAQSVYKERSVNRNS